MKLHKTYMPNRGDIVWINFEPQTGKEQSGRRPAVVLSPLSYNKKVGLAVFCPITSQVKGYPFEVMLDNDMPVYGVILSDQIKNFDWLERECEFICRAQVKIINEVTAKINILIQC